MSQSRPRLLHSWACRCPSKEHNQSVFVLLSPKNVPTVGSTSRQKQASMEPLRRDGWTWSLFYWFCLCSVGIYIPNPKRTHPEPSSTFLQNDFYIVANYFGNSFGEHYSDFIAIIETWQHVDMPNSYNTDRRDRDRDSTVVDINNKSHVGGALSTRSNTCFIIYFYCFSKYS